MKPCQIIYYRGFGSPNAVWLMGRVLRQNDLVTPAYNQFGVISDIDDTVLVTGPPTCFKP